MTRRVLLLDNADSFTWNLAHQLERLGARCTVISHTDFDLGMLHAHPFDRIVLSPGPGHPRDAVAALSILAAYDRAKRPLTLPLLGVCLGHQCMAWHWGGARSIGHAKTPKHGSTSDIHHTNDSVFRGLPDPLTVARYHSLVVRHVPRCCRLLAWTDDQTVMAMRHASLPVVGVQFHPESFLTPQGDRLIERFLSDRS